MEFSSHCIQIDPRLCANYRVTVATLDPFAFPDDTPFLFFRFNSATGWQVPTDDTCYTCSVHKRRKEGNYNTRHVVTFKMKKYLCVHTFICGLYECICVSKLLKRVFTSAEERIVPLSSLIGCRFFCSTSRAFSRATVVPRSSQLERRDTFSMFVTRYVTGGNYETILLPFGLMNVY